MKKVLALVSGIIVIVLIACFMSCAFVPKNFDINVAEPEYITIYKNGTVANEYVEKGTEQYNTIMRLYKESFKTNVLNALFQGKAFSGVSVEEGRQTISSTTLKSSASKIYIEFSYTQKQVVKENGVEVEGSWDNEYLYMPIEVTDSTSLTQISAFARYGTSSSTDNNSYYHYTAFAIQHELFTYLNETF